MKMIILNVIIQNPNQEKRTKY